jgi:hypothetical protein
MGDMKKTIDDLKGVMQKQGMQKASHFYVDINCPISGPPFGDYDVYVVDVTMPGRNMMTSDIKYGTNIMEKRVNGSAYSPCSVTFMCDANMKLWKWFLGWQDFISRKCWRYYIQSRRR